MTDSQRMKIVCELWPAACRAQGWKVSDRERRLRVCSDAVKRPISSMTDLNNGEDIDAVFAHLRMLTDNLQGTIETEHPEIGEKRRLVKVVQDFIPLLGFPYYTKILRDRFGHTDLDQLDPEQLRTLRFTLTARHRAKVRRSAPKPVEAGRIAGADCPF
jgi:hypothetical protein